MAIIVPASVKDGSRFTLTVTGQSGKFNQVGVTAHLRPQCGGVNVYEHVKSVRQHHAFKVSWVVIASHPGTHTACAWLDYHGPGPSLNGIFRSKTYQVTP